MNNSEYTKNQDKYKAIEKKYIKFTAISDIVYEISIN